MKHRIAPILMALILGSTLSLTACQKTPEERLADQLKGQDNDKEVERLNRLGRSVGRGFDLADPKQQSTNGKGKE